MAEEKAACQHCNSSDLGILEERADRMVPMKRVVTFCRTCGRDVSEKVHRL